MTNKYEQVKKDFMAGRIKGCRSYFESNGYYTEAGYCYIILKDLKKAKKMFEKLKDNDTRANWGLFLLQMINEDIKSYPSYFEIRNFLEIDLNILILYCNGEYIEKIMQYADFMFFYNPETYKFFGRAFWANGFLKQAKFFLNKSKDKFYRDPELHYLLAYIYYKYDKDYRLAKKLLDECLKILPQYNPAEKLRDLILLEAKL